MSPLYTPGKLVLKKNSVAAPLLDLYPGADAAYSLRSLTTGTERNVIRVRRSSDSTEQDFTASQVTDGTLTTFCGANNGFVHTWYDQSGNNRHAVQTITANQPQIVSSGAVITTNSKPSVLFDGTDDRLNFTGSSITTYTASTTVSVQRQDRAEQSFAIGIGTTSSTGAGYGIINTSSRLPRAYVWNTSQEPEGISNANQSVVTALLSGTSITLRQNEVQRATATNSASVSVANSSVSIGAGPSNFTSGGVTWSGWIQEQIVYTTARSDIASIESTINAHYAIY